MAGEAPPNTNHHFHYPPTAPTAPTAWDFIKSQPDLSSIADIMESLGLDKSLSLPFSGTLLLPNNDVSASAYTIVVTCRLSLTCRLS
jgi:hypothetical protein